MLLVAAHGCVRRGDHLTVQNPIAKIEGLPGCRARCEALIELGAQLLNDLVDMGLEGGDTVGVVKLGNGLLFRCVLCLVNLAEEVVDNMAIDEGTASLVILGLWDKVSMGLPWVSSRPTFLQSPLMLKTVLMSSG